MLKKTVITLALPLLFLVVVAASLCRGAPESSPTAARRHRAVATTPAYGTLQKMIVENGSLTINLDLGALSPQTFPGSLTARPVSLQFAVAANSFFPILVFNDLLRATEPGSISLIPVASVAGGGDPGINDPGYSLPVPLNTSLNHLVVEKLPSGQGFDLAVRDSSTGFTFFNVEGGDYNYDANAQSLSIAQSRLLISKQFANALGRADAGAEVGNISLGAAMQAIQITQVSNGAPRSVVMPPLNEHAGPRVPPTLVPGPDIIVGDLPDMVQVGSEGSQVGLGVATTSCNNGDQPVNFHALPETDHPFFPQNLYRMSGGADNTERFEQIGQAWIKHAFGADELDECNLGCDTSNCTQFQQLCPGCADPYLAD
ncbi:MAG: hypothetical protein J2P56_02010, partial [Verrucomicrobia bacterium]|nr:hypothetical protein [Verrucomicrobiota bacterium]